MQRGRLITFEGGEGCGKSTQLALTTDWLRTQGVNVCSVREPGGVLISEQIRKLLLDPAYDGHISPMCEMLLYQASRVQLVKEIIIPQLGAGVHVLCDRYYDATSAYQGYGRGMDLGFISMLNHHTAYQAKPDLTIFFDLDPAIGLQRAQSLQGQLGNIEGDRLEQEGLEFHNRVYAGYQKLAAEEERIETILVGQSTIAEISGQVREIISGVIPIF